MVPHFTVEYKIAYICMIAILYILLTRRKDLSMMAAPQGLEERQSSTCIPVLTDGTIGSGILECMSVL